MMWRTSTAIRSWLPRLQAHRGYWIDGNQQNSLKSVEAAYHKNYKMAEFDVRLTKDDVVILFHDEKYQGAAIDQYTFKDLIEVTAKEFPDVATLDEVLQWMHGKIISDANFDFRLNIEIKSKKLLDGRLEKKVYELIKKYNLIGRILISSFNPISLYRFRLHDPRIYRALLLTRNEESNFILNRMYFNSFILFMSFTVHNTTGTWSLAALNSRGLKSFHRRI